MIYIYYNPKANNGKGAKKAEKLYKKLNKKNNVIIENLDLSTIADKVKVLDENDKLILAGGDGTIHHFINSVDLDSLKCKVYLLRDGSGNDFAKGHKGKCFEITNELKNLPTFRMDEKEYKFINGVGIGVDALVCKRVNENMHESSYYKVAKDAFKDYKPFNLEIVVDGNIHHFRNVLFCACQNGKYFGGGMKIAPYAKREDEYLDLYIVHSIGLTKLLILFPLIFIGKHTIAKKNVTYFKCKNIKLQSEDKKLYLQAEGEVKEFSGSLEINR